MAIVERVSFRGISGWVAHDEAAGNRVSILVNGREVTHTVAMRPVPFNGGTRNFGFSRMLVHLWPYLDATDEVSFEHNGQRLPIAGHGFVYRPPGPREKDRDELVTRIDQGWLFDKRGRLRRPLEFSTRVRIFRKHFDALQTLVSDRLGLALFPIYGTLLGCVREGGFISHDTDVDLSYISKHAEPEGVIAEYLALCEMLIEHGYRGPVKPYGFGVNRPISADIYPSWIRDGKYDIAWGYHGEQAAWTPEMGELEPRPLGSMTVMVPRGAEAILAQIYGPDWRVPDPGFSHYSKRRKQSVEFLPTEQQLRPVFWKHYYHHNELAEESTFATFVAGRIASDALIVDVGCGSGRDTTFFAAKGFDAIGADASPEGVQQGQDRGMPSARFSVLDVNDAVALDELLGANDVVAAQRGGREIVVYMRFFLHAIPDEAEATLLEAIVRNVPTVKVAAEFRTEQDADIPKFNSAHYRRFLDSGAVAERLRDRYGFSVDYFHEGTGLSIFNGEDPFLCRIIASRRTLG